MWLSKNQFLLDSYKNSMFSFNFPILPKSLKYSIVGWLHDPEAHSLLQVNQEARSLIQKRGLFPKYIDEINVFCPEHPNRVGKGEAILQIYLLYNRFSEQNIEQSLSKWSFASDFDRKALWEQISGIRFCKKLYIGLWPWPNFESLIEQMEASKLFSKIRYYKLFQLESSLGVGLKFLSCVKPQSIEELDIFVNSAGSEADELEKYYLNLYKRPGFKDSKYIYLGCPSIDYWNTTSNLKAEHVGLCIDEWDELLETLGNILQKGIPNKNPMASFQIRSYLDHSQTLQENVGIISGIFLVSQVKEIKSENLKQEEVKTLKKLGYYTSRPFMYESLRTLQITSPAYVKDGAEPIAEEKRTEKYFKQTFDGKEYLISFILEDQTTYAWPSMCLSIVWNQRNSKEVEATVLG